MLNSWNDIVEEDIKELTSYTCWCWIDDGQFKLFVYNFQIDRYRFEVFVDHPARHATVLVVRKSDFLEASTRTQYTRIYIVY